MQLSNLMRRKTRVMGICAALILGATMKGMSDEPSDLILDLFVQKGFVSQQEADKVKAQAEALRTNQMQMPPMPENQWKISKAVKDVGLFGDVRLRYEDRSATDSGGSSIDLRRFRYSVRVGLRGDLFDDFYGGVRVDTAANPRSSWVSFGSSSSGVPYNGPYGKSTAGINIGQAYLGWRTADWFEITVGKMPNPLYTTPMVWDSDLNPEGAAEHFKYTVGEADFFANFGQFFYASFYPNSASGGLGINGNLGQHEDNIFQLAWQAGFQYHFATNISAKVAATLYDYLGVQQSSQTSFTGYAPYFGDPYIGEGAYYIMPGNALGYAGYGSQFGTLPGYGSVGYPLNQVGLNHLLVVEFPFELDFKVWKLDAQLFGDFAYNLQGAQRARDAAAAYQTVSTSSLFQGTPHSFAPQTKDVKAYQIGLDVASSGGRGLVSGTTAQKHAWEFRTYWQHVEQYSLDPNLVDSDFFEGRENLEGIYLALAYGITDNFIGTFRYGNASRINHLIGSGGSNQDIPWMNPINAYEIFQLDLTFKF